MAFEQDNYGAVGGEALLAPSVWSYKTADSLATITALGYFDDKQFELETGDIIYAFAANGAAFLEVTIDSNDSIRVTNMSENISKTAFGEQIVAQISPVVQASAQYNTLGSKMRGLFSGTGASAGASNGEFSANSGTSPTGFGSVFSKLATNYHAGQGILARFTARFDTPVADNNQTAGLISATDQFTFGYNGEDFGIFYRHHGQQEIQELEITSPCTNVAGEAATVTVDGNPYSVTLTDSTVQQNALEIAVSLNNESALALWEFEQIDDTVIARSLLVTVSVGSFAFSSGTAVASWTQIAAINSFTPEFINQDDWSENKKPSLDTSKGNVYEIQIQYLGYGAIKFLIEDENTGDFDLVHVIKYPNTAIQPLVSNPSFRIGWSAGNAGGTTDTTIRGASCLMAIEGVHVFTEQARSFSNIKTGISTTETNILTIENREVFGTKVNLGSVIPELMTFATDSTKGAIIELNKAATVAGSPNFQYINKEQSIVVTDTAGTTTTNGDNIITVAIGPNGSGSVDLSKYNITLLPGERLTVSGRVTGGSSSDIEASLVWQEDI